MVYKHGKNKEISESRSIQIPIQPSKNLFRHIDCATLSCRYYYRCMLCVYESKHMIVYVCVWWSTRTDLMIPCLPVAAWSQPAVARLP